MERRSTICVHRWVLSEPQQGHTTGLCRRCGASKRFPSGLELPEGVYLHVEPESDAELAQELASARGTARV